MPIVLWGLVVGLLCVVTSGCVESLAEPVPIDGGALDGGPVVEPSACADGLDNDGDELVDLADPGCAAAEDDDEHNERPDAGLIANFIGTIPLTSDPDSNPCYGSGGGICKHARLAVNPMDGLLYVFGGDHSGSGENRIWSLDVENRSFQLVQPSCREDRGLQPRSPDEVPWVWDSNRKRFWYVPGFSWAARCGDEYNEHRAIMLYDPENGGWESWGEIVIDPETEREVNTLGRCLAIERPSSGGRLSMVHDAPSDRLYWWTEGGWDSRVRYYDVASDTCGRGEADVEGFRAAGNIAAVDAPGRRAFLVSPCTGALGVLDLSTGEMDLRSLPDRLSRPRGECTHSNWMVWDSHNSVVIWPEYNDGDGDRVRMHVYHPDEDRWEIELPYDDPMGFVPVANHAAYDPKSNVVVMMGSVWNRTHRSPNVFLYRYR